MQWMIDNFFLPGILAILVLVGLVAFVDEESRQMARDHPCWDAPCNW